MIPIDLVDKTLKCCQDSPLPSDINLAFTQEYCNLILNLEWSVGLCEFLIEVTR